MCGIGGVLRYDGAAIDEGQLLDLREAMAHRGPDGAGTWLAPDRAVGLVHRRLAIVDPGPAAAQPMASADGKIVVTFNGEIYSHLTLRRDLEEAGARFATDHSDTEVLIHGYRAWGFEGLLERLDGMFAFALWDADRQVLLLARDRIGIKPLYFARTGGVFRFASEIKALIAAGHPAALEPGALTHYLCFLVAPAPMTMVRDVFKLPAGTALEVKAGGSLSARRYWSALPEPGGAPPPYCEGVKARIVSAVEKRMMADVPIGVFLSGGIDSAAVAALMRRAGTPVASFTIGFDDHPAFDETADAAASARALGTEHHEIRLDAAAFEAGVADIVEHQDEPLADSVCVPLIHLARAARQAGVPVVQVGEGSDELFCGYESWRTYLDVGRRFWSPYCAVAPTLVRRGAAQLACAAADRWPGLAPHAELLTRAANDDELFWSGAHGLWDTRKSALFDGTGQRIVGDLAPLAEAGLPLDGADACESGAVPRAYLADFDAARPGSDPLARMTHSDLRLRLPELLLMRIDKMTMAHSLEARVPFLDPALVTFALGVPMAEKLRGAPKALLRSALADSLPAEIRARPKRGFGAPVAAYMRGAFGRAAEDAVTRSALLGAAPFRIDALRALFAEHRDGRRDHAQALWTLANLALWHERWITA